MASLRDIKKRIRSVKSTQKITRAMKLVSAAKLRRAQQSITQARPYAVSLHEMISRIAARTTDESVHPLLDKRPDKKRVLVIAMTSDRGMCGGFNTNIIRRTNAFLAENKTALQNGELELLELTTIGRRGRDFYKKRSTKIRSEYTGIFDGFNFGVAKKISEDLAQQFLTSELDAIYVIYTEFKSAMTQTVKVERLLPIEPAQDSGAAGTTQDFLYEPNQTELLSDLLPRYLATQVYRALLESQASEHGARMSAMESATKNAGEMIDRYTLIYNRARQAAITKELMEIISGSEAQKG